MKIYGINRKIIFGFARKISRKIGVFSFDGMGAAVIKRNCLAGNCKKLCKYTERNIQV